MVDSDDEDGVAHAYASPPCFMHELTEGYMPDFDRDPVQWRDVIRWRTAERARRLEERLAVPPEERRALSESIAAKLTVAVGDPRKHLIGVYWPIRGEPDLRQWMVDIVTGGGRIALPVVIRKAWPLEYRVWRPGDPLERGVWNILVPSKGPAVQPSVVIAPVVGFDDGNYRLGYGGGFFDRTLAAMPKKPLVIGVGFARSRIASIYPQPHDIPMDMIITEE